MMYKFIETEIDNLLLSNNNILGAIKVDATYIINELAKNFNLNIVGIYQELWIQLMDTRTPNYYIQDENGWKLSIARITYPCFLLIDNSTDKVAYKIKTDRDLLIILENTTGFTYYLCNNSVKSVTFFNFHDVLAVFSVE